MHLTERDGDAGIGQPAQQARCGVLRWRGAKRFNQQDLHQTFEDEVAADIVARRFLADEADQLRQPRDAANMDHAR